MKGSDFRGILFAKFDTAAERDSAVSLLRDAGLKHNGQEVWAKEDLPLEVRAAKNYLLSLKRTMKEWGFDHIQVDEGFTSLSVGPELVVSTTLVAGKLTPTWHSGWGSWDEFQNSPELRALADKSEEMLNRAGSGGKGKGAAKGAAGH